MDNLGIIFHIAPLKRTHVGCDPSLEPSRRNCSNEGSQHMFLLRNKKLSFSYPQNFLLSGALNSPELLCRAACR